mgnify:CR=1 FL=1
MYTGNYECLELFVKPEAGKKDSVTPEEGKRKQNRNSLCRNSSSSGL